jgi:hypothetical protein
LHLVNSDRRSKTPTPAFRYGEPPTGHSQSLRHGPNGPNVKPRSKTPGPQPPRPHKPNGYLPQQPVHELHYRPLQQQQQPQLQEQLPQRVQGHDGIYENLPARRDRSKSPSTTITTTTMTSAVVRNRAPLPSSGFASATPNYVPVSAYMDNNRWSQHTPTPMDRSYTSATTASAIGFELVTVNLIRQPNGFGFRVVGGTEVRSISLIVLPPDHNENMFSIFFCLAHSSLCIGRKIFEYHCCNIHAHIYCYHY